MSLILRTREKQRHASCTVEPGRDRISRDTGARSCSHQCGVSTGNGSTRLAAGLVMMRKPAPLRFRERSSVDAKMRQLHDSMNIGMCNIRTMTIDGKVKMVQAELGRYNIISKRPAWCWEMIRCPYCSMVWGSTHGGYRI